MLRFLLSTPWLLLRFLLVLTDRDYSRMLVATGQDHSLSGYWEFIELRREEERAGEYDRTNKLNWENLDDFEEDADPNDTDGETEPGPSPSDRKTSLQKAEKLLGLVTGKYDEKELKSAQRQKLKKAHPDKGGTTEAAQAINAAHDTIQNYHGWGK